MNYILAEVTCLSKSTNLIKKVLKVPQTSKSFLLHLDLSESIQFWLIFRLRCKRTT